MWWWQDINGVEWSRWFLLDRFDDDLKLWKNCRKKGKPIFLHRHWLQGCSEDPIQIHVRSKWGFLPIHYAHCWACILQGIPKMSSFCLSQNEWSWRYLSWMVGFRLTKGVYADVTTSCRSTQPWLSMQINKQL